MQRAQREKAQQYGIRYKGYDPSTAKTRGY